MTELFSLYNNLFSYKNFFSITRYIFCLFVCLFFYRCAMKDVVSMPENSQWQIHCHSAIGGKMLISSNNHFSRHVTFRRADDQHHCPWSVLKREWPHETDLRSVASIGSISSGVLKKSKVRKISRREVVTCSHMTGKTLDMLRLEINKSDDKCSLWRRFKQEWRHKVLFGG